MSGESSTRSDLIDVTYQHIHAALSSHLEGNNNTDQIIDYLEPRIPQLSNISAPFGTPTDASKEKIESGSVTLRDDVVLRVEPADKEYVYAISKRFNIDEVEALVLLRSFVYNEGLPEQAGSKEERSLVDELLEAITPFYYSERLCILRTLIPLLRAHGNQSDPASMISSALLSRIYPNGTALAESLIAEYVRKVNAKLPEYESNDPRRAAAWARQNAKEQLVMLEVLFWAMWSYAPCNGPTVVRIFETAYDIDLGWKQRNETMLLDDEGTQLKKDSTALWMLVLVEALELEDAASEEFGPSATTIGIDLTVESKYWSFPDSLQRIHELILSHTDGRFAFIYVAWAYVLSRLEKAIAKMQEVPPSYAQFFESLVQQTGNSYSGDREQIYTLMVKRCMDPDVGLFNMLYNLLTDSPLFVTAAAWRTASTVTDPNNVAYRALMKGFVVAMVELVPVEEIPDFESFVEVWIALFGRSESLSITAICAQFWEFDYPLILSHRAILDVARTRFPVQFRPLIRILRAMTAAGFLGTDPLSTADHALEGEELTEAREICMRCVFNYFQRLPTYTQAIPATATTGSSAMYEKLPERYGSSSVATGVTYANTKALKLPGGSILPPATQGRLLSGDGGDLLVIAWHHEHSGWKLLLEFLNDYVNRKRLSSGAGYYPVSFTRSRQMAIPVSLEEIGVEMDLAGDEAIVTDILDLIRSVIQDNPPLGEQLMVAMESGGAVVAHTMVGTQPPDLIQLTVMILEDAMSRSSAQPRDNSFTPLITSAMSVLSALLALPRFAAKVWLYVRSTTSLFGSEKSIGFTSAVLATERLTGHYTMTLALLHLVQQLFREASSSVVQVLQENPKLHPVKQEVLLRMARFVHAEIWVEHMSWKYAQLGARFEIGRRVSSLYAEVLQHSSPALKDGPFGSLSQAITEVFLLRATTSTITPLVSSLTTAGALLDMLYSSRRYSDARRLIYMLESHLSLTCVLLTCKQTLALSSEPSLLEQALCAKVGGSMTTFDAGVPRIDPVDALAAYIKGKSVGSLVPVLATRVLFALCSSLSSAHGSPPTIIGHLSDPEATVSTLVHIVQHPYDDPHLRNAVWDFITLAVDKEPALARLFVTGHFRAPNLKASEKGKERASESGIVAKTINAVSVACDMLVQWKELYESNPQLLASLLRFLDVVWQHGHEHKQHLEAIRNDTNLFERLAAIIAEELGPSPDYRTQDYVEIDGRRRSTCHEAVSAHCYRIAIKAHAVHIVAVDIRMHLDSQPQADSPTAPKPPSYIALDGILRSKEQLTKLIQEAVTSVYDPGLYDELADQICTEFPSLIMSHLKVEEPMVEREYGDAFAFSTPLFQLRLQPYATESKMVAIIEAHKRLTSINLNLSLTYVQTTLTESWQYLLLQTVTYVRAQAPIRRTFLELAVIVSDLIASESRSGDMMSEIHCARLSLLLAMLEVVWFSDSNDAQEVEQFVNLVANVREIILNASQPPSRSLLRQVTVPFHQPLLQIIYFCVRQSRKFARLLKAAQRLKISAMLEATLTLVITHLRLSFDNASVSLDLELDQDMQLLVAVFEQCTRLDLNPSPLFWLTRCQETDVIRASLHLYSRMDLVGLSDIALLRARKQPLYAPHVLMFHMALANIPSAAERLASEGVLSAYSDNGISSAIQAGLIDVVIPELPGERSPAHHAYCSMLSVVAGVITAVGRHGHYFDAQASGLLQLFGDQIHRALSWTIDSPLSLPLIEEMEQSVNVFAAIAQNSPRDGASDAVKEVLRFFTMDALFLLQQLNYALTHPNHLASLFEPITADERTKFEAESGNPAMSASGEFVDFVKRPFLTKIVHRLFLLSGSILSALIAISGAETVLLGDQEDWPISEALVVPHSKVVLGESASMGTLLELGNCSLDVLRFLVDRPLSQAITLTSAKEKGLDVRDSILAVRRTLDAVLLYGVTQLAMWLSKPEFDVAREAEVDEMRAEDMTKTRRQAGMTLAERLRRGMTGEMAADLQAMLVKAKPIIAKCEAMLKSEAMPKSEDVDLTQVLSHFVHERIAIVS